MMEIGLIDVDGNNNFPNLALMKISSYHKNNGDNVEFATMFNNYDIIYKSKIFTWSIDENYAYNTDKYIYGGTGYDYSIKLLKEIDEIIPDYDLYNCKHAYGFLTRGCINNCSWCIVPKKEGNIKKYMDIDQIISDKKSVILMDNNILSIDYGLNQIEKIIKMNLKVDFNQGLDARLIDNEKAKLLSRLKWLKPLRLACDSDAMIEPVYNAVELLRKHNTTPKNYFCYVLVKDIKSAFKRVEALKEIGVDPFAQSYRDFKNKSNITYEQKLFCRWVNHKAIFKSVEWNEYKP